MASVEFRNVTKRFGSVAAVDDVSLTVERGELFFLLGPSGCGKTTALRMLAGFVEPDGGTILFDGRDVSRLPAHRRNVGMVFQTYALFPHMTVERNVEYGLRFRKTTTAERASRVTEALERTRLSGLGPRYPSELSGGQQQRVALARALAIQPEVLLLDEPLSNLDTKLRVEVREEIKRIHQEFKITAVYVTHDQDEALSLADRMAIMRNGRIEQEGTPAEIYAKPRNEFVAGFVGETNLLDGTAEPRGGVFGYATAAGWIPAPDETVASRATARISLRPECVRLGPPESAPARGVVRRVSFFGGSVRVEVELESGAKLTSVSLGADARLMWREGDAAGIAAEADNAVVLE
jgi:iron(III) transport system ATP-binding protein